MPFACSICEQESTRICAFCTKDACDNHLCERCGCCSDCCECDLPLDEAAAQSHAPAPIEAGDGDTSDPVAESEPTVAREGTAQPETQPAEPGEPPSEPLATPEV